MFSDPIVKNASGAIALLFRMVIDGNNLRNLLDTLVETYAETNSTTSQEKSKIKTNYNTHLDKGYMTIKIFNVIFKNIVKSKGIRYTIDIVYNGVQYSSTKDVNMVDDGKSILSDILKDFLVGGLNADLDTRLEECTEHTTSSVSEKTKKKYNLLQHINSKNLSFKIFVHILSTVFKVSSIGITVNIKHTNKISFSDTVKISL